VRVLYFTRDYTPHDHRFLSTLAASEHEVFSLRLERRGRLLEDRPLPFKVRQVDWLGGRKPVGFRDFPRLWADLRRVLREVKPDLVHAGPVPSVAFLAALAGARPLVSMSWGSDLLRDIHHNPWLRRAARYALDRSDVLLADCLAVMKEANRLGFPSNRVVLFPWGVDLERFSPGEDELIRQQNGWEDCFVLLSARSWEPIYGVDVIVRAFVRAAQAVPRLRLILLGGGSQAAQIRSILTEGEVLDRVYFAGQVANDQLAAIYRSVDLYLSASHSDGSSVSLMEALACGLPALVSDIPGNREWLQGSAAGWLFADGEDGALANGIINAESQQNKLAEMGRAARQLAEERADWNQNSQKLWLAYRMAVERRQRG
jgi:glycosyltransferase involved in cell wall biosynthesis